MGFHFGEAFDDYNDRIAWEDEGRNLLQRRHITLSEKFLSFHKVIIDEQQFLIYIILLN